MTSLFRLIKSELDAREWTWLRMPGQDFSELIKSVPDLEDVLCEVETTISSVARVFVKPTSPMLMIVAEPEPISPSPFSYGGDRLTVGFSEHMETILHAMVLLNIDFPGAKQPVKDANDCASPVRKMLHYAALLSDHQLQKRALRATLPDPKLEREGSEFFEMLNKRIQAAFLPDYIEIQLLDPTTFWSDRPEGWSWIQTSSSDFQWPVSIASEHEWELFRSGKIRFFDDVSKAEGIMIAEQPGGKKLNTGMIIPLSYRGRQLGILKMFFVRSFIQTVGEETALDQFQEGLSLLLDRSREYLRTQRMAMVDGLTDLFNHRFFHAQLRTEFQRSSRYHSPMTLIMIDIDDFKQYNDSYGHQAGDRVLAWVARKIRSSVRDIDFVARYGGEEFALILPEIKAEDGLIVAEKIRKAVSSEIIVGDTGERLRPITISCGVTDNQRAHRPELMVEQADKALYWVKRHGRNLVRLAETES
jgi:diguanylate cyclase (GGDEF)-like protein